MTSARHVLTGGLLTAPLVAAGLSPARRRARRRNDRLRCGPDLRRAGKKDEYYLFYSGGHSGQVYVAGLPSMRHIATIPVFAKYPGTGYGYDEESRQMLGDYTWGDVHHPGLSQTDGNTTAAGCSSTTTPTTASPVSTFATSRPGRSSDRFPNSSGNHGSSFVTENSEYVLVATRFSVPLPKGRYADPSKYETEFNGMVSGLKVDPATGTLSVGWQILTPPFNWDLGSTGKGPSSGWAFWTSYNSEMASTSLKPTPRGSTATTRRSSTGGPPNRQPRTAGRR